MNSKGCKMLLGFTLYFETTLLYQTSLPDDTDPAIVTYGYDELGQIASKTYGTGANSITETYDYNIRGWLAEKKSDVFDMDLRYNDPHQSETQPSWTGNITEWEWKHKGSGSDNTPNSYAFTYDNLSRLTDSQLFQYSNDQWQRSGSFEEWLGAGDVDAYDKNGNILSLMRSSATGSIMDGFRYEYNGNQLTKLYLDWDDDSDFVTYDYDANGNCTVDGLNALKLEYNYLNLTSGVRDMTDNLLATYSWLADGRKAGVRDANGAGFEYLGSLIYTRDENDLNLESASFGSGRINKTSGGYETSYFITDHLGSVRATVNQNGALNSTNNYYPFGLRWNDPNALISTNRWLYSGKEMQITAFPETSGIFDFGWRMYEPRIIRMKNIDPMAEDFNEWSPYNYALNNPIAYIDLQGLFAMPYSNETKYVDEQGSLLYETNDGLTDIIVIPDSRLQEFEAALNKLNEEGEIDDPEKNRETLHVLGTNIDYLKKELLSLYTQDLNYSTFYELGYDNGYKGRNWQAYDYMHFIAMWFDDEMGAGSSFAGFMAGRNKRKKR